MSSNQLEEFFAQLGRLSYQAEREHNKDLSTFFDDLSYRRNILILQKRHFDLYLSSNFNVFEVIRPDENKLSDILSDILDPDGSHGQGGIFLQEFLRLLNEKGVALSQFKITSGVKVTRERSTFKNRRIDILLIFAAKLAIGIENKPWSLELDKQIEHYINHIRRYEPSDAFVFLFLHPIGQRPESIEEEVWASLEAGGKCKTLSYKDDLRVFLQRCYEKCNSAKYRFFLLDFMNYIKNQFVEV